MCRSSGQVGSRGWLARGILQLREGCVAEVWLSIWLVLYVRQFGPVSWTAMG